MKKKKTKQVKKKLAICTPSRDGMFPINYLSSQEAILNNFPKGWDVQYSLVRGTSDITNARNTFINKWYFETDSDAMLFLDSDIGFYAEDLAKLLKWSEVEGVDFIGGNYPKKTIEVANILQCANNWHTKEIVVQDLISASAKYVSEGRHSLFKEGTWEGLCQVDGIGMGCFLITRKSAKKLFDWAKKNMEKTFFHTFGTEVGGYPVFNNMSNEKGNFGEDFSFCKRVKEAGLNIFCDPTMKFTHTGMYDYYGRFEDALIYFKNQKETEIGWEKYKGDNNAEKELKK